MGTSKKERARAGFTPPTVEDVEKFMKEAKKEWPRAFCERYAFKFVMHYRATGWKLSSGVPVKDWEAAFWARWAEPSYKEDQDFLSKSLRTPEHLQYMDGRRRETAGLFADLENSKSVHPIDHRLDYFDEIMTMALKDAASDNLLIVVADWLRQRNLLVLGNTQILFIKAAMGNDGQLGKIMAIKQFFHNLKEKGQTVKSFFHEKMQHAANAERL